LRSSDDSPVKRVDIKECKFNNFLTIAGDDEYCFDTTEFNNLKLENKCNVSMTCCKNNIGDISLTGENTLGLSNCQEIGVLKTNKNSKIIINKGYELHSSYNKKLLKEIKKYKFKRDSIYTTKIKKIKISEGLKYLHLVNCKCNSLNLI